MSSDDPKIVSIEEAKKSIFGEQRQQHKHADPLPISSTKEALDWVSKDYSPITIDGRYRIQNRTLPDRISYMTRRDFIDSFEDRKIQITDEEGKIKIVNIAELWLRTPSPNKHRYNGITFDPEHEFNVYDELYNTWPGFAVAPQQGDCSLFLAYVKDIICSGDESHYNWVMSWCAQIYQEPWN
jgi:hypothetical protein